MADFESLFTIEINLLIKHLIEALIYKYIACRIDNDHFYR